MYLSKKAKKERKKGNILYKIENFAHLNIKTLILIYLITRLSFIFLLTQVTWNNESVICYASDCKQHWRNSQFVVSGLSPYKIWKEEGLNLPLPHRADHPPLLYVLMPFFVWIWKDVWAMLLMFFLFDFINLLLVYSLGKFRKISSLLYIFAPSIFRGLLFAEDEIFTIAFILASVYFFRKKKYTTSTIMLALSFNIHFFPIVLFPILLLNMNVIEKKEEKGKILLPFPKEIEYGKIIKYLGMFLLTSAICHLFFFPDWIMFYKYRTFNFTLTSTGSGIWHLLQISPSKFYIPTLLFSFLIFYLYSYLKNLNIETGYLLSSLLFITFFPRVAMDHFIFILPLFLIWTKLTKLEIFSWLVLFVGVIAEFLALPSVNILQISHISSYNFRVLILLFIIFIFYIPIIKNLVYDKEGRDAIKK